MIFPQAEVKLTVARAALGSADGSQQGQLDQSPKYRRGTVSKTHRPVDKSVKLISFSANPPDSIKHKARQMPFLSCESNARVSTA